MKCSSCQFENLEGMKFCGECGERLEKICPKCNFSNPPQHKFCGECGQDLEIKEEIEKVELTTEGERKHVTVLFSDLTGYTAMSERLDPEEVKEIMSRIFGEIAQVVTKYEGFIEKFIGDAVMALFGVPKAHEDDPIRAIRVAREIHAVVDAMSPEVERGISQPISMHTGITTGLVVTSEVDIEKGTHGMTGDTINLASRLCNLAKANEIFVDPNTYRQAEGYFTFEALEPTRVEGKAELVQVYRVIAQKEKPITIHRLSGLRADLIGRKAEIAQLGEAVENLREGRGRIFSICGDGGTGKSRLIEEFKATLDLEEVQWLEGHAYAYSQNTPYFTLMDLLNRVFQIEEGDPPEKVREKVELELEHLVGKKEEIVPYVGSLYSLSYPEVEDISPEFWRSRLHAAAQTIISALAERAPTIFLLEDLHWADPSFTELLRNALLEVRQPAIVLCVYRPTFSLFTSHQLGGIGKIYQEIRLQDLSPSEAQDMLESLLKTEAIPSDLKRFVQDKAEGNPFYLEELVNSLIESETLIRDNGRWKLTRPISESEISSTIHGLIAGRLDRLEKETRRIIQEASVIGRAFLYEILKRVTELKQEIDRGLSILERLDLIRTRSLQPDLEYMFKHPLTQEVVYNGLLKKERQAIHEQIALVMESIFQDRLSEFYETLAFHFKRGSSVLKAVEYLVKSGKKSLARYAVEEAHQYFTEAYDILKNKPETSSDEEIALVDMLNDWGYVYYYLGEINTWIDLLNAHKEQAESLEDKGRLGMFNAWLGIAHFMNGSPNRAYESLCQAKSIGEETGDQKVIGYACTWLTWVCVDLARFDEAATYGEKAQEIARLFPSDQYLYFKSLGGLGYLHWVTGDFQKGIQIGELLLAYGERNANSRSKVIGHWINAQVKYHLGDIPASLRNGQKSIEASEDPTYIQFGRLSVGSASLLSGDFAQAEKALIAVVDFFEKGGCHVYHPWACLFLGFALIAQGRMNQGMELFEKARQMIDEGQKKVAEPYYEYALGKTYSLIATGPKPSLAVTARNIGFLAKNVPTASKKAAHHLKRSIEVSKEIGANAILALAYLDLGLFYKSRKEPNQAREYLFKAIDLFAKGQAESYLKQAKDAMAPLE